MDCCLRYLRYEAVKLSHAVKAHLYMTAGIAIGLYIVGTWVYHAYSAWMALR